MIFNLLEYALPFFVIVPVIIAVLLYVFFTLRIVRLIAIVAQGAFVLPAFFLLLASREQEIVSVIGGDEGVLGISLRADNLAAVFILLTVFIFLAVSVYTIQTPYDRSKRLYLFLLFLLEGALIGLFLTRDFFNIFVLVEVGTVLVAILLMYDPTRRNLFAGMTFIMVNIVVMQFYLFGLGYLYMLTGVLDMEAAGEVMQYLDDSALVLPYALIMTSVASKCALLPMLTWLPKVNAFMGSRFTVAAIISGLHIKSGVYLFIRFQELFGGIGSEFFLVLGLVTAAAGVILALAQKEVRLLLAYSTMAQMGLIVAGLSIGEGYSHVGSLMHVVNHAVFKAALFLCASQISYIYYTRDITKIRGAFRQSPVISVANIMAILGIVGAPLFGGSVSKYFLAHGASGFWEWAIIVVNLGTVLVFVKYSTIFFGRPIGKVRNAEPDWCRMGVVIGLGICSLALGVGGVWAISFLFNQTVTLDLWGYLEKTLIFVVSFGVAVVIYKKVLAKFPEGWGIFRRLEGLVLNFQIICVSVGVFFGGVLIYIGMFA